MRILCADFLSLTSLCFVIECVKSVNVYKIFSHTLGERRWKSEMELFFQYMKIYFKILKLQKLFAEIKIEARKNSYSVPHSGVHYVLKLKRAMGCIEIQYFYTKT